MTDFYKPNHITPYLPQVGINTARNWIKSHQMPALVLAFDVQPNTCKNCGGNERVYLRLCGKGPYRSTFLNKKPFTYFDGNGQFGKGWYTVDMTEIFDCPACVK
jgi:hypothetical protein